MINVVCDLACLVANIFVVSHRKTYSYPINPFQSIILENVEIAKCVRGVACEHASVPVYPCVFMCVSLCVCMSQTQPSVGSGLRGEPHSVL